MRSYLGSRAITVAAEATIRVNVTLEPDLWMVWENDIHYCVISLQLVIDEHGIPHTAWPKGLPRHVGFPLAGRPKLLQTVLPRDDPQAAWRAIPPDVRSIIEDAYFLARTEGFPPLFGVLA